LFQFGNNYFFGKVKQAAHFAACLQVLTGLRSSKTFPGGYSFFQVFANCIAANNKESWACAPAATPAFLSGHLF